MKTSEETKMILGLLSLKGIGPGTVRHLRNLPNFAELSIEQIANDNNRIAKSLESNSGAWEQAQDFIEEQINIANKEEVRILSFFDTSYPALLASSKDDPCVIYVKGKLPENPNDSVAVIGTREPSKHGVIMAERITAYLVEQGQSIVSGLALGCDSIAHETALRAKGHTVAVMAHGLQTVAPASNRDLASRIVDSGGALVSQYPFGQEPSPYLFVQRDKTQAAMARGVVMIQSDVKGGSLHASSASIANGRWLAVPIRTEEGVEKFGANDVLTRGTNQEKAELLKCNEKLVENCIVLESKDDYSKLLRDKSIEVSELQEQKPLL